VVTHVVFFFLGHRVFGVSKSVHSPKTSNKKDLMFTNVDNYILMLPVA
jgi:hypothetical protein